MGENKMVMLDDDMEFAKDLRIRKNQRKSDFEKILNKGELTSFEMDELFNEIDSNPTDELVEEE